MNQLTSHGAMQVRRDTPKLRQRLLAALAALSFGPACLADPLHEVDHGAFQHEDSGWIFPREIDGFVLIGEPQTIDGTTDVNAHYERVVNGSRTTASVDVYSSTTAVTLARAKTAVEVELKTSPLKPASESPFNVGSTREVVGSKVIYAVGADASRSQRSLYFIDTGEWIVTIRGTAQRAEMDTSKLFDDFAREQRWDSLGL